MSVDLNTITDSLLERLIKSEETPTRRDLLDLILPSRRRHIDKDTVVTHQNGTEDMYDVYKLEDIEKALMKFHDEVETVQKKSNDEFVDILDESLQAKFKDMSDHLERARKDLLELQYNIKYTKETYQELNSMCDDRIIGERRLMNQTEQELKQSLQQSKFKQIQEFFDQFLVHLDASVATCRKVLSYHLVNSPTSFDWTHYHQAIYLLRACGKALIDVDRFERLYQFYNDFYGFTFKQPLATIDLNNFIEFHATYSIETQLNVIVKGPNDLQNIPFSQFISDLAVDKVIFAIDTVDHTLFKTTMDRLNTITTDCCRLLLDLNLNFIEAHLTSGINIDKLNGAETVHSPIPNQHKQQQTAGEQVELPRYAFAPHDYITRIGQHMLTLRKQTEPYDQADNRPLKLALEYLRLSDKTNLNISSCKNVTDIILKCVARHCIRSLIGRTNKSVLSQLSTNGHTQLSTDATYLDRVLVDLQLLDGTDPNVERFKRLICES